MRNIPRLARNIRRLGLVKAWQQHRQERTPMPHGERVASIEAAIGGSMRPGRQPEWLRLDDDEVADDAAADDEVAGDEVTDDEVADDEMDDDEELAG